MRHKLLMVALMTFIISSQASSPQHKDCDKNPLPEEFYQKDLATLDKLEVAMMRDEVDVVNAEFQNLMCPVNPATWFVYLSYKNQMKLLIVGTWLAYKMQFFPINYLATKLLYLEMLYYDLQQETVTLALYFKTNLMMSDTEFQNQRAELKTKILDLKTKLAPQKQTIMSSLVNDIKNGKLEQPTKVFNEIKSFLLGQELLLLTEVVRLYLSTASLTQFTQLYNFIQTLNDFKVMCHSYAEILLDWRASGDGESMEALVVWIHASEIAKARNISDTRCSEIAEETAPAYYQTLVLSYKNSIEGEQTKSINDLHMKYKMGYFLAEYIGALTKENMKMDHFIKVSRAIVALPNAEDKCFALAAAHDNLKKLGMLGAIEHLEVLMVVKIIKRHPGYAEMSAFGSSKCKGARENAPAEFLRMLGADPLLCQQLNRLHDNSNLTKQQLDAFKSDLADSSVCQI